MHHSWIDRCVTAFATATLVAILIPTTSFAQGQVGNSGVQQRAPGYGTGGPSRSAPQAPPGSNLPSGQQGGRPSPPNQQLNPQFNPQLNPNSQNRIEQAVRDGQQWQMQGPNNGGQVVTERPFPELNPQEQQYVDQLLKVWEDKTAGIERFSAEFIRWEYDSHAPGVAELARKVGRPGSDIHIAAGKGVIRFQKPDKGLFRTDKYFKSTGNVGAKGDVELSEDKQNFGEYVICDGKNVWDYDRKEKICTRLELPPQMQGLGIMNSPLPFLFGVKAEEIKSRYWVRALPPGNQPNGQPYTDRYAVEAYPKYPVDAVNYHHVQIVLDREQFLPIAMILFLPEWTDKSIQENGVVIEPRDKRMFYQFDNRRANANIFQLINEKLFLQEFIPTDPPADWKRNDIPFVPADNTAPPPDAGGERTANPALPAGPTTPRAR
ncbi:MAG: TIGR03009 domain-containing protein [Planctomycetota bacterium]